MVKSAVIPKTTSLYGSMIVITLCLTLSERHRVKKKDLYIREGKGRRFCLGVEFIKFLAKLTILHQDDMKKRTNRSRMK